MATSAGVILGTAAYMSPEQARGKLVDRRTDIWSLGCVLYECLTGTQLFAGETVSDVIARIPQTTPDWNALPATTPPRRIPFVPVVVAVVITAVAAVFATKLTTHAPHRRHRERPARHRTRGRLARVRVEEGW
jgi:serine/threonine protein kinase